MTISHGSKTLAQVARLLQLAWQRAGISFGCELCGRENWNVIHDGVNDGLGLSLRSGTNNPYLGPNYLVYAAECQNCGNVRVQGKAIVERLANEQIQALPNEYLTLEEQLTRK
tara:strand:- start:169 stop:507 length:339 start_codon:yes stop_codon:yes gene_type:complete